MVQRPNVNASGAPLAEVIPLARPRGAVARTPPLEPGAPEIARARESMARAINLLERHHEARWGELPTALGRLAATAESLLERGPPRVDPWTVSPVEAAEGGLRLVQAAVTLADSMAEETEVLGEALGADLHDLPLGHLDDLVVAVADLGLVSRVEPTWAKPLAANAAQVILEFQADELRDITELHHDLYAGFTDHVLDIPEMRLRRGRRPWRVVSRARLRRALASTSRSGSFTGSVRVVADQVLMVHQARRHLMSLAPLLSTHLGREGWGPLGDVDALVASLTAVRQMQRVLGERLDPDRMAALLAADAFRSTELLDPASKLRVALGRWQLEVTSLWGGDPWELPADALAEWASRTAAALPAITLGSHSMDEIDGHADTLRSVVDDLLLRDKVAELVAWLDTWDDDGRCRPTTSDGAS